MLSPVAFTIPGPPTGKGRPRATTIGGHARMYTPAKTASYESTTRFLAAQAMNGREPFSGPVALEIEAVHAAPLSWSKKRRHKAIRGLFGHPTKRPDLDNIVKTVADAMNGIVYTDDALIVALQCSKRWGERSEVRVRVGTIAAILEET